MRGSQKNLFVSLEISRSLKTMGFNEPCIAYYRFNAKEWERKMYKEEMTLTASNSFNGDFKEIFNDKLKIENIAAPLYWQVINFLRERNIQIIELPNIKLQKWVVCDCDGENKGAYKLDEAIERALALINKK